MGDVEPHGAGFSPAYNEPKGPCPEALPFAPSPEAKFLKCTIFTKVAWAYGARALGQVRSDPPKRGSGQRGSSCVVRFGVIFPVPAEEGGLAVATDGRLLPATAPWR
jgi:hypothetical protein